MLELRQLRYFVAVAEELHFGHAAERLNIVQPALSMQIKSLEETLGTALFQRDHHHVMITPAGKLFYREAIDILERTSRTQEMMSRVSRGELGQIRIGMSVGASADATLPKLIKTFRKRLPEVHVDLMEIHPAGQAKALLDGEVDLVFGPSAGFKKVMDAVDGIYIDHFDFKLACSTDHPLAADTRVHVDALRSETFVGLASVEDELGMSVTRFALSFAPRRSMQVHSPVALFSIVEANLAVSIVSEALQRTAPDSITFLDLDGVHSNMDLYLYTKAHTDDNIVQAFREITREVLDS